MGRYKFDKSEYDKYITPLGYKPRIAFYCSDIDSTQTLRFWDQMVKDAKWIKKSYADLYHMPFEEVYDLTKGMKYKDVFTFPDGFANRHPLIAAYRSALFQQIGEFIEASEDRDHAAKAVLKKLIEKETNIRKAWENSQLTYLKDHALSPCVPQLFNHLHYNVGTVIINQTDAEWQDIAYRKFQMQYPIELLDEMICTYDQEFRDVYNTGKNIKPVPIHNELIQNRVRTSDEEFFRQQLAEKTWLAGADKPDSTALAERLTTYGMVDAKDCLFIGDTWKDAGVAHALGIPFAFALFAAYTEQQSADYHNQIMPNYTLGVKENLEKIRDKGYPIHFMVYENTMELTEKVHFINRPQNRHLVRLNSYREAKKFNRGNGMRNHGPADFQRPS